jgi:hypothetical protein
MIRDTAVPVSDPFGRAYLDEVPHVSHLRITSAEQRIVVRRTR